MALHGGDTVMTDLGIGRLPPAARNRQNNDGQSSNGIPDAGQQSVSNMSNGVSSLSNTPVIKSSASQSPSYQPSNTIQTPSKDRKGESPVDMAQTAKALKSLPYSSKATGLCYDTRMRFHTVPDLTDDHPEDPDRITSIFNELREAGLVNSGSASIEHSSHGLVRIPAYSALKNEICLVHTEDHYHFIKATAGMPPEQHVYLSEIGDSVYYNESSSMSARLSAGGAINCSRFVVQGKVKNAIAVVRPPGHHAEQNEAQGFCLFNNVAIAAKVCQQEFPEACRKVLILDWDVHHGNGVQHAFYDDPNVLYISLHRWDLGPGGSHFYPGESGAPELCGTGAGAGFNVNIPFSQRHMNDADYIYAFQEVVMPIAYEYDPDLVIISAGFDAADGDELGSFHVTPPGYGHMTHMLKSLAGGKMAVCLEGGYNLQSISKSALAVTRILMGEPPDRLAPGLVSDSAKRDIVGVKSMQARFWNCMSSNADIDQQWLKDIGALRLHDVFRGFQSSTLYNQHRFIRLAVLPDHMSESFRHQILASRNHDKCHNLLVIFHDPPEVVGTADPVTKKLDPHNYWMTDIVKYYIDQSLKEGWGVIDVNIPKHFSNLTDNETQIKFNRPAESMNDELALYLWENYIETNEDANILLLGVGDAYHTLCHLLNHRPDECMERVKGIVSFVADNKLISVTSDVDSLLSSWYHQVSKIYVAANHLAVEPGRRVPKRKFGTLIRSPDHTLSRMLARHKDEVFQWFEKCVLENTMPGNGQQQQHHPGLDNSTSRQDIAGKQTLLPAFVIEKQR